MVIAVCVLLVLALVVIAWALVMLFHRLLWPSDGGAPPDSHIPPYGEPTELGPVGGLGQASPDADLSQGDTDSDDMYGA